MRRRGEKGQAVLIVVIAIALVLIGGIGLAIDSSQLYGQRQMGQVAADAAALGAIMSIFNKTNVGGNVFGSATFICTVTPLDARTPCKYARSNGFGKTSDDQVSVDFPPSVPGVNLSSEYPVNVVHVLITRSVSNWFIKLVGGPATTSVKAAATAAIVDVLAPVPIIVLHPTLDGSFQKNGSNTVTICGGPSKSIQVNSNNAGSISISGVSGTVDLSHAGPDDPGDCSAGTGADLGNHGGPQTYPGTILLGTRPGKYIQPASRIGDPLINVPEPALPPSSAPAPTPVPPGVGDCRGPGGTVPPNPCMLYQPGRYDGGIGGSTLPGKIPNNTLALFSPGVYYLNGGGFHLGPNNAAHMATTGATPDPTTGMGVVFFSAGNGNDDRFEITANSGQIVGVNYGNTLVGAPGGSIYKGIVFFEQRTAAAHTDTHSHNLQGGGGLSITGTIYLTNTEPTMTGNSSHYQALQLQGTPGSNTTIIGEIIVDTLSLGGNAGIMMNLNPAATLHVSQVALVK